MNADKMWQHPAQGHGRGAEAVLRPHFEIATHGKEKDKHHCRIKKDVPLLIQQSLVDTWEIAQATGSNVATALGAPPDAKSEVDGLLLISFGHRSDMSKGRKRWRYTLLGHGF